MNEPTKPYELTFEERPLYLYARITADETDAATALAYWKKITDKCRELEVKRLMVEQVIPDGLSTTDTFTVASGIVAMGIYGVKIAFVDPYPENYEQHQFGELVGGNRGAWGKVFTTVPESRKLAPARNDELGTGSVQAK